MSDRDGYLKRRDQLLAQDERIADLEQQLSDAKARIAIYKEISQFSRDKWFAFYNPDEAPKEQDK